MEPGTSMESRKHVRCTGSQLALLAKFMSLDPHFANMQYDEFHEYEDSDAKWEQLKNELKEYGPDKSVKQWKQSWRDLKRLARRADLETLRANTTYQLVLDVIKQGSNYPYNSDDASTNVVPFVCSKLDTSDNATAAMHSDESLDASCDADPVASQYNDEQNIESIDESSEFQFKRRPRVRVTKVQLAKLVDIMSQDLMFAHGQHRHGIMDRKWRQLKDKLKVYGPDKAVEQWKQTWRDLKSKVRQTNFETTIMSDLDKKIVDILNQKVADTSQDESGLHIEAIVVANNDASNNTGAAEMDCVDSQGASGANPIASPGRPANTEFDAYVEVKIELDDDMEADTSLESKKRTRCTNKQLAKLAEFMSLDPILASTKYTSPLQQHQMQKRWRDMQQKLRNFGPDKTIEQWKHTWRDLKKMARRADLETLRANRTYQLVLDVIKQNGFQGSTKPEDSTNGESSEAAPDNNVMLAMKTEAWQSESSEEETVAFPHLLENIEFVPAALCNTNTNNQEIHEDSQQNVEDGALKKRTRCTNNQLAELARIMRDDPVLVSGKYIGPCRSKEIVAKWANAKERLKNLGPDKTVDQWKKTWRDLKNLARRASSDTLRVNTTYQMVLEALKQHEFDEPNNRLKSLVAENGEPSGAASDNSAGAEMHTDEEQGASSDDDSDDPSETLPEMGSEVAEEFMNLKKEQNALLNKLCGLLEEQNKLLKRHRNPFTRRANNFKRGC